MISRYAVTLHKGGVGKTTTTVNVAGVLAESGHRVLLIDCDSQGDLSSVFLDDHEQLPASLAEVFADEGILTEDLIQTTAFENLFIIPADRRLEAFEQTHGFKDSDAANLLSDAIDQVADQFDYVLMDTATRPHLTGYAALVAADCAIIPLESARFSFRSVASIRGELDLETDAHSLNPELEIRYVLSRQKKSRVHDVCREALVDALGQDAVLHTSIPDSAAINTAMHLQKPVVFSSPKSKAADAYRTLVAELPGVIHHVDKAAA